MTSLERIRRALRHEETDRVPRLLYGEAIGHVPAIEALLKERCAPQLPREYFDMDITGLAPSQAKRDRSRFAQWHGAEFAEADAANEIDEWGVRWKHGNFFHFAHIESPLREVDGLDGLKNFPWPNLDNPARYQAMTTEVEARHQEGFATCAFAGSVFEQAWYILAPAHVLGPETPWENIVAFFDAASVC
ncbi:MAG: hypothetical protein NTV93_20425 [Verrucomicrobia bacterium]|nr:hypothetical protein [Verrucomicrobiota bacterium]